VTIVPSSISSSETAETRAWARTWILAIVFAVCVVSGLEMLWRSRGYRPSVSVDLDLWSIERNKAYDGGADAVVIIGSSRVKAGVNPDVLGESAGIRRPIQLAIDFTSPLLILDDLAADPAFRGLVIVDVAPIILFNAFWPQVDGLATGYLAHRAAHRWSEHLETRLSVLVETTFAFRLPQLVGNHLVDMIRTSEWPPPQRFRDDGRRSTYFTGAADSADASRTPPPAAPLPQERMTALIARVKRDVDAIRSRGGRVVFLQMPTAGVMGAQEEKVFPRDRFWDVLAANVDAVMINSHDYPELMRFIPADGSHLKSTDAAAFSRELGRVLAQQLKADSSK
jgi:hypothetical protein